MGIFQIPKYNDFKKELILFNDIEDVSNVSIILPDPPNKNKIANYNLSTARQKFYRTPMPNNFDKLSDTDKWKFIDQEWRRRIQGYWFYNHGQLMYMPGIHYFYCNWWLTGSVHPFFRVPDRDFFLHWKKAEDNLYCAGLIEMANRRSGKSSRAGAIVYEKISRTFDAHGGIQSKSFNDAKEFFRKNITHGWRHLPYFFQPAFDNSTNPSEGMRFFSPAIKGKNRQIGYNLSLSEELRSFIDVKPSHDIAFDGARLEIYIADEDAKLNEKEGNAWERWDVVKKCLTESGKLIGMSLHTSTVELMEKEGGKHYKKIWEDSDLHDAEVQKNYKYEFGHTRSWLWQHFTPAYRGWKYDEYGNSLDEENKKELLQIRKILKGNALSSEKRKNSFLVREAFRTDAKDCNFDAEILNTRLEDLSLAKTSPLVMGNFEWKGDVKDTFVEWSPCSDGKFLLSHVLPDNEANKYYFLGGMKYPLNTHLFCSGADPFKYRETLGGKKSQGAGAVFMKYNPAIDNPNTDIRTWKTNRFCCTYSNRPDKEEYLEDMLKMCVYFGCELFSEINIPDLWDYFILRGYIGYLFYRKDLKTNEFLNTPGAQTNVTIQEQIYGAWDMYIKRNGLREYHSELLIQCRDIDDDMGKFDLFVAGGYALLANQKSIVFKEEKQDIEVTDLLHIFKY